MGKPIHRRTVTLFYMQLLYDYIEGQGHDPVALLGEPWLEVEDGIGGVDILHWEHLLQTASAKLHDPLLAIHVGQTVTVRHLGVLGAVLFASRNAVEALQRLQRYIRLVYDVVDMILRFEDGCIIFGWDDNGLDLGGLVNETGHVVMMQFARLLVRGNVTPILVTFKHAEPENIEPYESYFGCQVKFGESKTFIKINAEVLALPLRSSDSGLIDVLEQHANRLLDQLPKQSDIVEKVRRAIAASLNDGEPDIKNISSLMCLSARTLQRRLSESNTTFRKELNVVRYELAQSYMRDPRLQITDVALLLGYTEHSAFTRACKEWSGKTPQEARKLLLIIDKNKSTAR